MSIGHHPDQEQYEPDMKKPENEISEDDRAEAQRRIEGSINPDRRGTITGKVPTVAM